MDVQGPASPRVWFPRTARLLIASRGARSVAQGALVVDFALYLHALRWSGVEIGSLLTAGLLLNVALTLVSGPLSDRFGRRSFLIGYELLQLGAAASALLSSAPQWLVPAAMLGGFGRGANGSAGPFAPVEQAWLADGVRPGERGVVYSVNAAVGSVGMGVGAAMAALPAAWQRWLGGPSAYRPLFALVALGALGSMACILSARERPRKLHGARLSLRTAPSLAGERRLLGSLMAINALNGFGVGLAGSLVSYWFLLRFMEGAAVSGPVMAAAFALTGVSALGAGWMSLRIGVVRTTVAMRMAGLALLALLPLAPSFALAATCYVLRAVVNRGTAGSRQALTISLVAEERRGLAASANAASMQIPRAFGPLLAGALFDAGHLAAPFLLAMAFQSAYLYGYNRLFRAHDPFLERRPRPPARG